MSSVYPWSYYITSGSIAPTFLCGIALILLGMPDSEAFGDVGVDTFGHIAYTVKTMEIPNLKKLGMLNLHSTKDMQLAERSIGSSRLSELL